MQGFASIGGNLAMFQNNRRDESRRQKRQVHHEEERRIEKKAKLEPYTPMIPPANAPNILANYDITQIPVSAIVNLCMTVLQTVPLEVMTERVAMVLHIYINKIECEILNIIYSCLEKVSPWP